MTEPSWRALAPIRETDSVTALAASGGRALAGTAAGLFRRGAGGWWQRLDLAATEIQAIVFGGFGRFCGRWGWERGGR